MSEQSLHEEIDKLRARLDAAEECSYGLLQALMHVLPPLLQGHPKAAQVQQALQAADDRFEALLLHPQRAQAPGETHHRYEPLMQLNRMLAILGVWPGLDPSEAAKAAIARRTGG